MTTYSNYRRAFVLYASLLFVALQVALAQTPTAYTLQPGDVTIDEHGYITACTYLFSNNKDGTNLTIPPIIGWKTVRGIGANVFSNKNITHLNLPGTIKHIREGAFEINNLQTLTLKEGVERIDYNAFNANNLTSVNVPQSLIFIGLYAFRGVGFTLPQPTDKTFSQWRSSTGVNAVDKTPNSEWYYFTDIRHTLTDDEVEMENGVIKSCSYNFASIYITVPDTLDGQAVEGIGKKALAGKNITTIKLPNTLTYIGEYALEDIDSVVLPNSVTYIEKRGLGNADAFTTKITLGTPSHPAFQYWVDDRGNTYQGGQKITGADIVGSYLRTYPYTLNSNDVTISNGDITSVIYTNANPHYRVIIPNRLQGQTVLHFSAYYYGVAIEEIHLPNTLETINSDLNYSNLDTIILPNSLKYIGFLSFFGNRFSEMVLPQSRYKTATHWQGDKRYELGETTSNLQTEYRLVFPPYTLKDSDVVVKNGVIISCSYDFQSKDIIIPEILDKQTVTGIIDATRIANGEGGLFQNKDLTSVSLPSTLKYIGAYAFAQNRLDSLTLPDGLTTIGQQAFYGNFMDTVILPNSILSIGQSALFSYTYDSIVLPTPTIPQFKYWKDDQGNTLGGGEKYSAKNNNRSYKVDLSDVTYTLTDDDVVMEDGFIVSTTYHFATPNIIIPDTLQGQPVIGIGRPFIQNNYVFRKKGLKKITFPKHLQYLGYYELRDNELDTIILPQNITYIDQQNSPGKNPRVKLPQHTDKNFRYWNIVDGASLPNVSRRNAGEIIDISSNHFYFTNLSYTLTDDDVVVEDGVIVSCSYHFARKYITIPDTLDNQTIIGIGTEVFSNKKIRRVELPKHLRTIYSKAFLGNIIDTITFPNQLSTIEREAFYSNNIDTITIPKSVVYIGEQAFRNNNLTSLKLPTPANTSIEWVSKANIIYKGGDIVSDLNEWYGWKERTIFLLQEELKFGELEVGNTLKKTLTISNGAAQPLQITGISLPIGFSGDFNGEIPVNEKAEVVITFTPVASQSYEGKITVHSDAIYGDSTLTLKGVGATREIQLSANIDFGEVAKDYTVKDTLAITNKGGSPLTIQEIIYPEGFTGQFTGKILPTTTAKVVVTFAPTELKNYGGTVTVQSDAYKGVNTIVVAGKGVPQTKEIELSGNIDFGDVNLGETKVENLTITNKGNSDLYVDSMIYPEGFSGLFSDTLSAGETREVKITFAPLQHQTYDGTVRIQSNATLGNSSIKVTGRGRGDVSDLLEKARAFSPNGDGKNDLLVFPTDGFQLTVISVKGTVLYQAENYQNDWDGTITQGGATGDKIPRGSYYTKIVMPDGSVLLGAIVVAY